MPLNLKMRTNSFVPNSSNISARYTNHISLHNIHYYIGTNNRTKLSDKILLYVIKNVSFNITIGVFFGCRQFFYTKNSLISSLNQVSPDFIASLSRFLPPFPPPQLKFLPVSIASLSRFYSFPVPIFTSLSSSPPKVSPGFYSSPVSIIFYLSSSPPLAIPLLFNFNSLFKPAIFYM